MPKSTLSHRGVRLMARESMQRFGYDPLDELVKFAQDSQTESKARLEIAQVLLPYMYPKLSSVVMDTEVGLTANQETQDILLMKVLSNPELADAAARLSLAAAECAIACSEEETGMVQ